MPQWTQNPPADSPEYAFRIRRTPAAGKIEAYVTCTDVVGCNTHFLSNRTVPCEGPDCCQACADGFSYRWHGYLTALDAGTHEHFLFEFTAQSAETFANYAKLHAGLRGCRFKATRPSGRPNGRVLIQCAPADLAATRIPAPANVQKLLCHIWGIKYDPADVGRKTKSLGKDIIPTDAAAAVHRVADSSRLPSEESSRIGNGRK